MSLQSSGSALSCVLQCFGSSVIQTRVMDAQTDTELYADCNYDEIWCKFKIILLAST